MSLTKIAYLIAFTTFAASQAFAADAKPSASKPAEPSWVDPMRKVHAAHKGRGFYVAQLGDSITYSMAFWSPLDWHDLDQYLPANPDDGLPKRPEGKRWRDVIGGIRNKGPELGNYGGWRTGNLLKVLDKVLADKQPAAAIIMLGTNDISANKVPRQLPRRSGDDHQEMHGGWLRADPQHHPAAQSNSEGRRGGERDRSRCGSAARRTSRWWTTTPRSSNAGQARRGTARSSPQTAFIPAAARRRS